MRGGAVVIQSLDPARPRNGGSPPLGGDKGWAVGIQSLDPAWPLGP